MEWPYGLEDAKKEGHDYSYLDGPGKRWLIIKSLYTDKDFTKDEMARIFERLAFNLRNGRQ